jgi:hypothetical protein
MRTFELHRDIDETGISGIGIIAEGVEFTDGTCALRWLTANKSSGSYDSIESVRAIHGHGGKTRIVYTGDPFQRGMFDCLHDSYENAPFNCAGGAGARPDLRAPKWITPNEQKAWLDGYKQAAKQMYGDDWSTCEFGWAPAITIPGQAVT